MTRCPAFHKSAALVWLACFLTVLTCLPVSAAHVCCGNCAHATAPPMGKAAAPATGASCCTAGIPIEPECACKLQSDNRRDQQPYTFSRVTDTGNSLPVRALGAPAAGQADGHLQTTGTRTVRMDIRPRSGPIYLANQTFLC